jgi:hypothetical protein
VPSVCVGDIADDVIIALKEASSSGRKYLLGETVLLCGEGRSAGGLQRRSLSAVLAEDIPQRLRGLIAPRRKAHSSPVIIAQTKRRKRIESRIEDLEAKNSGWCYFR